MRAVLLIYGALQITSGTFLESGKRRVERAANDDIHATAQMGTHVDDNWARAYDEIAAPFRSNRVSNGTQQRQLQRGYLSAPQNGPIFAPGLTSSNNNNGLPTDALLSAIFGRQYNAGQNTTQSSTNAPNENTPIALPPAYQEHGLPSNPTEKLPGELLLPTNGNRHFYDSDKNITNINLNDARGIPSPKLNVMENAGGANLWPAYSSGYRTPTTEMHNANQPAPSLPMEIMPEDKHTFVPPHEDYLRSPFGHIDDRAKSNGPYSKPADELPPLNPQSKVYDAPFKKEADLYISHNQVGSDDNEFRKKVDEEVASIVSKNLVASSHFFVWLAEAFGVLFIVLWAVSFIPQVMLNWKKKSVAGLSVEFVMFNFISYTCYVAYAATRYAVERNFALPKAVGILDVVIAVYGLVMSVCYALQVCWYSNGSQKISTTSKLVMSALFVVVATNASIAACRAIPWYVKHPVEWNLDPSIFTEAIEKITGGQNDAFSQPAILHSRSLSVVAIHWLDLETWSFLQCIGFVKVFTYLIRFLPQIGLNGRRRSTEGLSSLMVVLELFAALCTFGQSGIDAVNYNSLIFLTGTSSISKILTSILSALFAMIIIFQALCVYRGCPPLDTPYHRIKEVHSSRRPFDEVRRLSNVKIDIDLPTTNEMGSMHDPSMSSSEDETGRASVHG